VAIIVEFASEIRGVFVGTYATNNVELVPKSIDIKLSAEDETVVLVFIFG
jgi:hypothetical protein